MKNLLKQLILKIILGLYITYETLVILGVILGESTFGVLEKKKGKAEEARKKATGKTIMEAVQNLKKI